MSSRKVSRRGPRRLLRRMAPLRIAAQRHGLAKWGRPRPPQPRILCYHSVGTPEWGINDVSPGQFRGHIERALALGYRFVPAASVARGEAFPRDLAVTFDDGLKSVTNALPVLAAYQVPFTVFAVTGWTDGRGRAAPLAMSWRELEACANAGGSIGSHSVRHPNFARLTADRSAEELGASRAAIAARLGINACEFAIPFGRKRDWPAATHRLALEAGYTAIYAQSEERRPPGTVGRTFITRADSLRLFAAALDGRFDGWEE